MKWLGWPVAAVLSLTALAGCCQDPMAGFWGMSRNSTTFCWLVPHKTHEAAVAERIAASMTPAQIEEAEG